MPSRGELLERLAVRRRELVGARARRVVDGVGVAELPQPAISAAAKGTASEGAGVGASGAVMHGGES